MNLICIASNSKALIKMSLWNVHFEQQISIGKIFPFLNWAVAGLSRPAVRRNPQNLQVSPPSIYHPRTKLFSMYMNISNNVTNNV